MHDTALTLHGYWRSGTSYRTRIALNAKGLAYDQVSHDLRRGDQRAPDYLALNPQGLVPALEAGELILTQSGAIIEWLDERYPDPPYCPIRLMIGRSCAPWRCWSPATSIRSTMCAC
ncbi:glutathione S-transferase N-terminal domain-containing protein [Sphingobium sp. HWE2-09]|uniref:glutathione S-transferase N-terminal domain-containing protein n=1 Tax=Sphingobium sp. HWE2-09 TaxID=3108390 RepID=UPI00403EB548